MSESLIQFVDCSVLIHQDKLSSRRLDGRRLGRLDAGCFGQFDGRNRSILGMKNRHRILKAQNKGRKKGWVVVVIVMVVRPTKSGVKE